MDAAVETALTAELVIGVVPGVPAPWPRIKTDTATSPFNCTRPAEAAVRISGVALTGLVSPLAGLDQVDAHQRLRDLADTLKATR
ncbi:MULTISPECIES: hypothetical protein [Catenuloplanes]|uniref:Uncharacterized protein n=1 Tax=Catenuloplanes niger TaxID=587534 RepID=A0AAE4CS51_9ACTN|nr:hypothetical protein [Catenuloplanes niger]MDR7320833.1 hypothetical protein [Catenuloplanes niger]